jgi:hypothetical protein
MNERIKELMKQAGLSYLYDYDTDGHAMVCNEKDIKRFAELIVKECARVAFATAIGDGSPDEIHDAIKETFRS